MVGIIAPIFKVDQIQMPDKYKELLMPPVLALLMMGLRFLLVGSRVTATEFIGHVVATVLAGYMVGYYMIGEGYQNHETLPAVSLCGLIAPNLLTGIIKLSQQFKENPKGLANWIADIAGRFRR